MTYLQFKQSLDALCEEYQQSATICFRPADCEPPTTPQSSCPTSAITPVESPATANPDAATAYDNDSAEYHMGIIGLYIWSGFGVMGLVLGIIYLIFN